MINDCFFSLKGPFSINPLKTYFFLLISKVSIKTKLVLIFCEVEFVLLFNCLSLLCIVNLCPLEI